MQLFYLSRGSCVGLKGTVGPAGWPLGERSVCRPASEPSWGCRLSGLLHFLLPSSSATKNKPILKSAFRCVPVRQPQSTVQQRCGKEHIAHISFSNHASDRRRDLGQERLLLGAGQLGFGVRKRGLREKLKLPGRTNHSRNLQNKTSSGTGKDTEADKWNPVMHLNKPLPL